MNFGQEDQVGDRFKRIVDLVRDGRGHPAGRGDLFGLQERSLKALFAGDVAEGLGRADDGSLFIPNRRNAEGDIDPLTALGDADGLEVVDAFAGSNLFEDDLFF